MSKYEFILKTLRNAGDFLLQEREKGFTQENKDGDVRNLLTSIDLSVNDFLIKEIKNNYSNELIHSEELSNKLSLEDSFWCIDPIDGTSNFANEIPHFAICLSYFSDGKVVCGGAYNPVTRELFSVDENHSYLNGKIVKVRDIKELKRATVAMNAGRSDELRVWSGELYKTILNNCKSVKNLGSSALDFCFVGSGRIEACLYAQVTVFDIIFALEFIKKAGGVVTDGEFNELKYTFDKQKVFAFSNTDILNSFKDVL